MLAAPQPRARGSHIPLARCRVLYLGSAVPLDTAEGIDAVQRPLRERYPWQGEGDVNGIDAWLSVFSSGLLLSYVNDSTANTWFPISSLYVCAAVKCVLSPDQSVRFPALDSPEATPSPHPPLFTCIMRRTRGMRVLECHVFICKSARAAMALVQSCTHAYEHKEGWSDSPPPQPSALTRLVPAPKAAPVAEAPPEFYERPPPQGYFYATKQGLVKNYNVYGGKNPSNTTMPAPGGPGLAPPPPVMYPQGPPGAPIPPPLAPPGGYFQDWNRYEGKPVAVFEEYPRERAREYPREYRDASRDFRDYAREYPREYRELPREYRALPREYRELPREYREPTQEYRESPRDNPQEYRKIPREYREYGGRGGDDYEQDLVLYAPEDPYDRRLPESTLDLGDEHVDYNMFRGRPYDNLEDTLGYYP